MLTKLKRFLWDELYFAQQVRGITFLLGTLMATGIISLGSIEEHLGPFGWYVGIVLQAAALFVRAGDKNLPIRQFKQELRDAPPAKASPKP